jgi:hypothetical protein
MPQPVRHAMTVPQSLRAPLVLCGAARGADALAWRVLLYAFRRMRP